MPELSRDEFSRRKASSFVKKMILIAVKQIEDRITEQAVHDIKQWRSRVTNKTMLFVKKKSLKVK